MRVRALDRLVPGQQAQVVPGLLVLSRRAAELHEVVLRGHRRSAAGANGWRSSIRAAGSTITGSMSASGVSASCLGAEPRAGRSPPARRRTCPRTPWSSRRTAGSGAEAGMSPRKITSLAKNSLRGGLIVGRNSSLVCRTARIGRAQERAEALHAHQLVAVEHLLDEPPFPGRLVLDEQAAAGSRRSTVISRWARLFSRTTSPGTGSTSATSTKRPVLSGT